MDAKQTNNSSTEMEVSISATLTHCWNYLKNNASMYLSLYIISILPFVAAATLFAVGIQDAIIETGPDEFEFIAENLKTDALLTFVGLGLIGLLFSIYVNAAIVAATLKIAKTGEKVGFGEAWGLGKTHFGKVFTTGLLAGLIILGGFILLVVPGIIFLTWYYVAIAASIDQNLSASNALKESKRLTEDNRLWIFGLIIIAGLLTGALNNVPIVGQIIGAVLSILTMLFAPYVYLALKKRKDGSFDSNHGDTTANPAPIGKTEVPQVK